ncbi:MAG: group II intron reverse transcriptase domain-containing protein, partial [Candidatus Methanomethylophilaceae archaeon]|nr:group II intron reverse transcriptase domain-containing protein [Candidatus Methanomethylophilaceae archaeon]
MKRLSNLFERLLDPAVLELAAVTACRHRKDRSEVASFMVHKGENLCRLRQSLEDGTFRSSEYRTRIKNERGKDRLIADIALYPDRILHCAVCLVVEDYLDCRLVHQVYGGRIGKGQHQAVSTLFGYLQKDDRIRYALVLDIRHFYASIDKGILKSKLRDVIKDYRFLELMDRLIDDYPLPGLPLGSRFSSMLANLYLSKLDHMLCEQHHVHYYARFMDDFAILGYSKQWLRRILGIIRHELTELGLEIKSNWQIFPIESRGIDYVGYVIHPTHIMLRKSTKKRMQHAAKRISRRLDNPSYVLDRHDLGTIHSYEGCLKWCSGKHLQKLTFGP